VTLASLAGIPHVSRLIVNAMYVYILLTLLSKISCTINYVHDAVLQCETIIIR